MSTRAARFAAAVTLFMLFTSAAAAAQLAPEIAKQYVRPHQLVDVGGGRKINLFCMGSGPATALFDSGLSDWSSIWALVQPSVAHKARACSYDRAGMGYSDPADSPRSPIAIVDDMHELIHRAKLNTPLVLVGHSLGGFHVKLYAALYPNDVAGLVLVDPAEDRMDERTGDLIRRRFGTAAAAHLELLSLSGRTKGAAHFQECADAARKHDLDPASAFYKSCTDPVRGPLGPVIAEERQRLQVGAPYQETQASEFANDVYIDRRGDSTYAMLFRPSAFGAKPLIVLTHSKYDAKNPAELAAFTSWNAAHDETARLSSSGVNRIVPNTEHNIEIDDPQSIINAVSTVLKMVEARSAKP